MGSVVIRNLDDAAIARLKTKAELHGRSLEAELREIVLDNSQLSPEEKRALVERIRIKSPGWHGDSTELIRQDRDSR
ncbi:MAG: FitA-like ribbon-helix-helix domain-containing protein [Solirubrobacterales bacterium]